MGNIVGGYTNTIINGGTQIFVGNKTFSSTTAFSNGINVARTSGVDVTKIGTGTVASVEITDPKNNYITYGKSNTGYHVFYNAAGSRLGYLGYSTTSMGIVQDGNLPVQFNVNGGVRIYLNRVASSYALEPGADNTQNLGSGSVRWATVYAGTGTINTSDEREKTEIRDITEQEKLVAQEIKSQIKCFKFIDAVAQKGDKARLHFGVIAQQVKLSFENHGLNPFAYGILCYDEWEEQPEVINDKGDIVQHYHAEGDRYGVRYDELMIFMLSVL